MLQVVVPAYNEAGRLGTTLRSFRDHVEARQGRLAGVPVEVIVVDNASTDQTAAVALAESTPDLPVRVISCHIRGKGAAVRTGVAATTADLVAFMDADGATDFAAIEEGVRLVRLGADVAIGSRAHAEAEVSERHTWLRARGAAVFRALTERIVPHIGDTQCGMKVMRGEVARAVLGHVRITGFTFDVEMLGIAHRWGLRLIEYPVTWADVPGSSFRPLRHGFGSFTDLARVHHRLRKFAPAGVAPVAVIPRQPTRGTALDSASVWAVGSTGEL